MVLVCAACETCTGADRGGGEAKTGALLGGHGTHGGQELVSERIGDRIERERAGYREEAHREEEGGEVGSVKKRKTRSASMACVSGTDMVDDELGSSGSDPSAHTTETRAAKLLDIMARLGAACADGDDDGGRRRRSGARSGRAGSWEAGNGGDGCEVGNQRRGSRNIF